LQAGRNRLTLDEIIRLQRDLNDLMTGLIEANDRMREDGLDAVLKAAATAFGFVYVHPFQYGKWPDAPLPGSSRPHRAAICAARYGVPVSSVMFDRIAITGPRSRAHSGPLMPFIEWRPTRSITSAGMTRRSAASWMSSKCPIG
jgi:hypothetical protein